MRRQKDFNSECMFENSAQLVSWKVVKNENTQFPLKLTKSETLGEEFNNMFLKILQVTLMYPNI